MSKSKAARSSWPRRNFDLSGMLSTVRELIAPQAESKHIRYVEEIQLDNHWFRGDSLRISQILVNILGNAVKFTPAGGTVRLIIREEAVLDGDNGPVFPGVLRREGLGHRHFQGKSGTGFPAPSSR